MRYSSTLSLTSALDVREWLRPRPGRFIHWKDTRYPLYRRLGEPHGRSGRVRKISPQPGFDPRTVQPVAIPAHAPNTWRINVQSATKRAACHHKHILHCRYLPTCSAPTHKYHWIRFLTFVTQQQLLPYTHKGSKFQNTHTHTHSKMAYTSFKSSSFEWKMKSPSFPFLQMFLIFPSGDLLAFEQSSCNYFFLSFLRISWLSAIPLRLR
jgi:hypothetical protein